jgi:hypothetical protein
MVVELACIVEGHGESEAVPILIRPIASSYAPSLTVQVARPLRVPKSKLLKQGELERSVELAARTVSGKGGIIVLLDSDDDCPAEFGPALLKRAQHTRGDLPLSVVLAKREYEAWFLAAADSLRGKRGLAGSIEPPPDAEAIGGAKKWLGDRMAAGHYVETLDQPALTALFDLQAARKADSFDKCCREIVRLLNALQSAGQSA